MVKAPIPQNEEERIDALYRMGILDSPPEERFDRLTKEAIQKFGVILSTISIIDKDREWFKSCNGINIGSQGPRDISFCGHALISKKVFIVEDTTKDSRFADNPYVVGPPFIRFYAGITLDDITTNMPIGVFCIKDNRPREFSAENISDLMNLAKKAEYELNSGISATKTVPKV